MCHESSAAPVWESRAVTAPLAVNLGEDVAEEIAKNTVRKIIPCMTQSINAGRARLCKRQEQFFSSWVWPRHATLMYRLVRSVFYIVPFCWYITSIACGDKSTSLALPYAVFGLPWIIRILNTVGLLRTHALEIIDCFVSSEVDLSRNLHGMSVQESAWHESYNSARILTALIHI